MVLRLMLALVALWVALPAHARQPPNVLIIVTDDQGVDQVNAYAAHPDPPPTPNMDKLASQGVLFRNAWASPTCSPSRGALLTGRYPYRTGLGSVIHPPEEYELPLDEIIIPRMLEQAPTEWSNAAIGKWHIAGPSSPHGFKHPNLMGFDHYAGTIANINEATKERFGDLSYRHWEKVVNGKREISDVYATTATVDDALEQIEKLPEPWLVYVAFNAAHAPWHVPPKKLHNQDINDKSSNEDKYRAMVEALDTELGRLMRGVSKVRDHTTVIFLSDNGTAEAGVRPPWKSDRAKNSPYEGGVNVPLIVTGPQVKQPGSESEALVHVVDVFATVADIANVGLNKDATGKLQGVRIDGRSLLPQLRNPSSPGRDVVHTEKFAPNGLDAKAGRRQDWRITRNAQLKLIETHDGGIRLYDVRDGMDEEPSLKQSDLPRELIPAYEEVKAAHEKRFGKVRGGKAGTQGENRGRSPSGRK